MSKIGITKNWKKLFKHCFNAFTMKTAETQEQKDIRKSRYGCKKAVRLGLKTRTSK